MNKVTLCALFVVAALATDSFGTHEAAAPRTLRITGSSTMAPMLEEFARRFSALYPDARIEIESGGSGRGITDVVQGTAGIAMVSRALTGKESERYSFAIGRDGVGLVVHASNPVRRLTNRQVSEMYAGKVANWKRAGGDDAPLAGITPPQGYASVELFTIRSGNFPISRPLLLVTKNLPAGLAREFIRFSLSAQVTDIVTRHDFVPYLD